MLDHTGQAATFVDRGPCPLCAADATRRAVVHDFDQIPVVRCGSCGFMFSARVFTAEATARYYAKDWGSVWHRCGQEINARVNAAALGRLLPVREVRSMLDIGCGYGFLLAQCARRFGWSCRGVEVSAGEAAYARETLKCDVTTGTLEAAGLPKGTYDLVTSFEVIEHLLEPRPFLRGMVEHARPGGWVVVCTDNFAAPVVGRMGATFPKWIPHTHVSHFTPDTLRKLMAECGVDVLAERSWTNWETSIRALLKGGAKVPAKDAWSLQRELGEEMNRTPRLFGLRRAMNPWVFRLLSSRRAERGALMWIAGRRRA